MSPSLAALSPAWQHTLPRLLALTAWVIYWYRDTALAMVTIWERSETYTHAFLVPPIALWLIWRQRRELLAESPSASLLLAIPVVLTSIFWLLGELTAVNALTQFALVATLVLAIMASCGLRISQRIAFPLAFLFFAVPFGDFMMPKLMEWTAAFTVLAVRASGIPVYQEGLQFVIPSGNWSVVEACSGIRYIIASITVGTLFAYLSYVSLRRRLIFIGVALLVPVVANWLRAYMIVMLGHLSDNRLAAGVDHLIYGWLFFGLVIMIMFMIGARWSEDPAPFAEPPARTVAAVTPATTAWLATLGIALLAAAGPLAFKAIDAADQAAPPSLARPTPEGWQEVMPFSGWKPAYAPPSAELQTTYVRDGQPVGLYVGYYRNQDYQHKLVTSTNVLTQSTDLVHSVVGRGEQALGIAGLPAVVRTAELLDKGSVPEARLTIWHWYWINGRLTTSDAAAKLYAALSRLRGQGDDSAVVMLYAPREQAAETLPAFARDIAGRLDQVLGAARNAR